MSCCTVPESIDDFLPSWLAVFDAHKWAGPTRGPMSLRLATESLRKFVIEAEVYVNYHEIRRWNTRLLFVRWISAPRKRSESYPGSVLLGTASFENFICPSRYFGIDAG